MPTFQSGSASQIKALAGFARLADEFDYMSFVVGVRLRGGKFELPAWKARLLILVDLHFPVANLPFVALFGEIHNVAVGLARCASRPR